MPAPRDYTLLIDVGNTFLKWGLFRPTADGTARENRVESGHALLEEITALPVQFAKLPTPARIVISNVAGIARARVDDPHARSVAGRAGAVLAGAAGRAVRRHQQLPQSGAARQRPLGRADRRAAPARRARRDGRGVRHRDDDRLPVGRRRVQGRHDHARRSASCCARCTRARRRCPTRTASSPPIRRRPSTRSPAAASTRRPARSSACTRSSSGDTPDVVCVLSGGAAGAVAPRLSIPFQQHDNLVLEGLYRISQSL